MPEEQHTRVWMMILRTSYQRMSHQSAICSRKRQSRTSLIGLEKSQATLVCCHANNIQDLIINVGLRIPNTNGRASMVFVRLDARTGFLRGSC